MLHVNDMTYRVAGRDIFEGATVHIPPGHKIGVVGRNGAGKSTLLRLIAAEIAPDAGSVSVRRGARLAMVAQEAPGGEASLLDTVLAADHERAALLAEAETADDPARIADIHQRLADIDAHTAPARAAAILAGLGFSADEQARPCGEFSGGWRMRVALAAVLFARPDLLLLDEPTNYLDMEGALWLESYLRSYPYTFLLVSHDRNLLNRCVGGILHVEQRRLTLYRGGYDDFESTRRARLALQDKARTKQQAQRQRMQAFVDRFRYKATKARQAQSRLKAMARMEPIASVMEERTIEFRFPEPTPRPSPIMTLDTIAVGYDGKAVLRDLNLRLDMDDRIALLGRNGNGKSTLAKLLSGRLKHLDGRMRRVAKLTVGYFGQHQIEELNPAHDAFAHMAELLPDATEAQVRARLGAFGFQQDRADVKAENLSGGERARLVFALICVDAPQLLILDEPTNHLDIDTREVLVQALNEFPGAVLLVSHDRHLVELVADELWLVADGTVVRYEGDLDDYQRLLLSDRPRGKGANGVDRAENGKAREERKAARRAGAEARAKLAPLRKSIREAERQIEQANQALGALAAELADPKVYEGPPARVAELNKRRAELERQRDAAEHSWLAATEALERAGDP